MPIYRYKARDINGNLISGKIEKENESKVKEFIKSNGQLVIEVKKLRIFEKDLVLFKPKIKKKALFVYCLQFSYLDSAGITVANLLETLQIQTADKILKKQIIFLRESVLTGERLSDSMRKSKEFPELLINMTEVAEQTGDFSEIYKRMSIYYEKENKLEHDIKSALVYPAMISGLLFLVIFIATNVLIPNFLKIYNSNDADFPLITTILIISTEFLTKYSFYISTILILLLFLFALYLTTERGKYSFDKFLVKAPIIKTIYMKSATSRFVNVFSILTNAGYSMPSAIATVKKVLNNKFLDEVLNTIIFRLEKGEELGSSIKKAEIFDPMLYNMISIGEASGNLATIFDKCLEYFDKDLEWMISKINKLIEPLTLMILGLIVGFVMLAVMLPTFNFGSIL